MIALLTGYNGFIGQNLKKVLIKRGYNILGIEKENVIEYLGEDINVFDNLVRECDVIFHVGAISDTANQDYHEMLLYNYQFTKILTDLANKHGKKVIYSSSASVYGDGHNTSVPNNIYAWSKLLGEEYGRLSYPEGFTSLRYFNVYGPGEEHKGNMSSIGYQAYLHHHQNNRIYSFNLFPKKPTRDFVYVKDVVSANIAASEAECGIYDVGSGSSRSFEDFLYNMSKIPYNYVSEDKIPEWYQFYTKANEEMWLPNWEPMFQLEDGCRDYLNYLKDGRKEDTTTGRNLS